MSEDLWRLLISATVPARVADVEHTVQRLIPEAMNAASLRAVSPAKDGRRVEQ